jgi:group I intron endonuclease
MLITRALLKYGYSKFKLEILKYCSPAKCIKWEQFYMDLLKPEYNIFKIAGSSLGSKRSEESRALMSEAKKGENHPSFGKLTSEVTRAKLSASNNRWGILMVKINLTLSK